MIAGILALFAADLYARYHTAIEDAKQSVQSFADVLAEHTSRTFEAIDLTLRAANTIRRSMEPPMATSLDAARNALQGLRSSSPALLAIGWTDAQGDVLVHSYPGAPVRRNIADLPHFRALQEHNNQGLFISPLYRSNASGQWISSASLRFNNEKGEFAGAVTAPLDLSYFSKTFQSVQLGRSDAITLMRRDGTILTREPYVESAVGKSFSESPLFTQYVQQSQFGTFEAVSHVDGRDRINGFRVVPDLPLIILVTQDRADALAGWYRHLRIFGPLVLILVIILATGAALLSHKTKQHQEQTALLEATLQNMHEGLIVVDKSNRIAICNPRALELLELPPAFMNAHPKAEEVIAYQSTLEEFQPTSPEIKARVPPNLRGEIENLYERQQPNGTILEVRTVPFSDGGVVLTYKDITLQRRMEKELSDSEREFRILAENATDIIARFDFNGMLRYVSPSCEHILGYAPDELIGSVVTEFIHPDDLARTLFTFEAIVRGIGRADRRIEYRFRHKSGDWLWLEANPTVLFNEHDKPREFVDVVRDISDRKRMEAEAIAARAQAEQAAIAKGEFLATMSHEVRTPLNSIIGFSDLILGRDDLVPELRRQVGLIQTASESLLSIVNDVLDFSRIEEGRLEITKAAFNLADLVDGSVAIIRGIADAKRLDLRILVDHTVPSSVVGDHQRLRQVLLNLLNNAVKFTHRGFVQLDIHCAMSVDSKPSIRFSISDSGVGIPAGKQDRLFQRFSQLDGSVSREFGGSGLGLAICKKLIDLMGGEIGFDSRLNAGSTFWFSIPLVTGETFEARPVLGAASGGAGASRRILLVEDLEVNREIATAVLRNAGYDVHAVTDGADAVAAVSAGAYDLVLMDIQMPGMDGITATKILRSLPPPASEIPIIAMTANVLPDQIKDLLKAGMNDHVGKPFKPTKLIETIQTHIASGGGQSSDSSVATPPELTTPDQLQSLIPPDQLNALLAILMRRLEHFQSRHARSDRKMLQEEAHRLTSSAGLLGFKELSEMCSQLDAAISEDGEIEACFLAARRQSLAALEQLRKRSAASAS